MHHNGSVSLIDLIFVTNSALTDFCNVISPLGNSDHNGIHFAQDSFTSFENKEDQSKLSICVNALSQSA